jgi:hypothetical protein
MLEILRRFPVIIFYLLIAFLFIGAVIVTELIPKSPTICWQCGNHNPPHVALTADEVIDTTKKHKCMLWHQAKE